MSWTSTPRPMPASNVMVSSPPRCSWNSASPRSRGGGRSRPCRSQRIIPERKPKPREQPQHALVLALGQHARQHGVARVERDADRDRLAMAQRVAGEALRACGPTNGRSRAAAPSRSRTDRRRARSGACAARRSAAPDVSRAFGSKRASASALLLQPAEEVAHRGSARPSRPPPCRRACRAAGSMSINAKSLITANGGAKVPSRFLKPKALMAFFTPTPESSCASTVVGQRMWRTPRWKIAAAKPTASSTAPPPIATANDCRSMLTQAESSRSMCSTLIVLVLDRLAARHHDDVAGERHRGGMYAAA